MTATAPADLSPIEAYDLQRRERATGLGGLARRREWSLPQFAGVTEILFFRRTGRTLLVSDGSATDARPWRPATIDDLCAGLSEPGLAVVALDKTTDRQLTSLIPADGYNLRRAFTVFRAAQCSPRYGVLTKMLSEAFWLPHALNPERVDDWLSVSKVDIDNRDELVSLVTKCVRDEAWNLTMSGRFDQHVFMINLRKSADRLQEALNKCLNPAPSRTTGKIYINRNWAFDISQTMVPVEAALRTYDPGMLDRSVLTGGLVTARLAQGSRRQVQLNGNLSAKSGSTAVIAARSKDRGYLVGEATLSGFDADAKSLYGCFSQRKQTYGIEILDHASFGGCQLFVGVNESPWLAVPMQPFNRWGGRALSVDGQLPVSRDVPAYVALAGGYVAASPTE